MNLRTNSKINLFLRVLSARADGFHEVETIYHSVGLGDELTLEPTAEGLIEVEMIPADGPSGPLPTITENLVHKAAVALAAGEVRRGVRIQVAKRIPIAAGLGGGSGNAAGILVALDRYWQLGHTPQELSAIASQLGSDVPYLLSGGTALATGRGEKLTPLASTLNAWFVLGIANEGLATSAVYSAWDKFGSTGTQGPAAMTVALGGGDVSDVAALMHNDLEAAAFSLRPSLERDKQALLGAGATGALVSGSGPTMLGVAATEDEARAVASRVSDRFDRVEVVPSCRDSIELADPASERS